MKKGRIKIESGDKRNFTVLPNHILRCGGKPNEVIVLAVIASHAWEGSKCTASVSTIAKEAGVNRHTVIDAIRLWKERGQIEVERIEGVGMKIRTTFDFTATSTPWDTSAYPGTAPVPTQAQVAVPTQAHKEDSMKKTPEEDPLVLAAQGAAVVVADPTMGKQIAELFDVFKKTVNPVINFGNKTQRAAAASVIAAIGFEKALEAANFAVTVQGQQYAPTITTPCQLRDNLGKLRTFYLRENGKSIKNQRIKIS